MDSTEPEFEHGAAEAAASTLRTTVAIRERAGQLLRRARHGDSPWFTVDDGLMDATAAEVVIAAMHRFPGLHVPLHSRWRHFEAGGVHRRAELERWLGAVPLAARAHSLIDLTVVSVLLDGGAGPDWKYTEAASGQTFTRSEGLAVASYHAFVGGLFSSDRNHPLQADSTGLRALIPDHLAAAFQVTPTNPLVGLQERALLLHRLGEVIAEQPEVFGEDARPAGMFDMLISPLGPDVPHTADVAAHDILSQLLSSLSGIWPADNAIGAFPLGDCWRHPAVRGEGLTDGWMPLHKLSQWMAYSLLEPFEWSGVKVREVDKLTGLPEYRNGGLLIDTGLLRLRDEQAARELWRPGDEIIVEWRALTVALLDEVAAAVRRQLKVDAVRLPLARVLEGGTWAAGRELAQKHRGGLPPLRVASDGTVF
ncbi:URC4/urg3 family protein [Ramlibacter solisilvae]|uniref:Uracil phosphoribosyltransferase n=1 Tax=Ramlibacter tataouinensis TaxID=94132 RepID=A0A127JYY1_9BURK|nr:URC4/urg3 family protein [Ramlibacter tataouinensis]AMO25139.1 uracil phosphoribosyltransferase [Ramlibacter tataouinensis]